MTTKTKKKKAKILKFDANKYSTYLKNNTKILKYSNNLVDEALCNEPHSAYVSRNNWKQNNALFQNYFGLKILLGYFIGPRHLTFDAVYDVTEKVIAKITEKRYRFSSHGLRVILWDDINMNYSNILDADDYNYIIKSGTTLLNTKQSHIDEFLYWNNTEVYTNLNERSLLSQQIESKENLYMESKG